MPASTVKPSQDEIVELPVEVGRLWIDELDKVQKVG